MDSDELMPDFAELSRINETTLASRLEAVRAVLTHAGEKGRSLEREAALILREVLPSDYGLSSGFVVYRGPRGTRLSPQLDVIVYDAARSGPLARLGACDVFPLEAVYGYVEVKASLRSDSDAVSSKSSDSIEYCLEQNKRLRELTTRRFWTSKPGTNTRVKLETREWVPMRGYVFAFAANGNVASDPGSLAQRMADYSARLGPSSHLHGVFIAGKSYFRTRAVEPEVVGTAEQHKIDYVTEHALLAFTSSLLRALARFPRAPADWTPAIEHYFDEPEWKTREPHVK